MSVLVLHGYWRSTAAYRVRIGLNLKGLQYDQVTHDLRTGAHKADGLDVVNPQGLVPVLAVGDEILTQSLAILEWLEDCHPKPPLLPSDPGGRAQVRAMAALVACDIHPLNNLRAQQRLRSDFAAGQEQIDGWIHHWIAEGFGALEALVARYGAGFAYGATPTLADCCLVPQLYSAQRFGVDLGAYPRLREAGERARALPAFAEAHPDRQPDAG